MPGRRIQRRDSDSETSTASETRESPPARQVRKIHKRPKRDRDMSRCDGRKTPSTAKTRKSDQKRESSSTETSDSTSLSCPSSTSTASSCSEDLNVDLMKEYINVFRPRNRDITRPMKEAELKELCLRMPCRVDMTRWNPVHDYYEHFEETGRLEGRSPAYGMKLVAKAVNRHKRTVVPATNFVRGVRTTEWARRKRDHLMSLRLWQHDKQPTRMLITPAAKESEEDQQQEDENVDDKDDDENDSDDTEDDD